MSVRFRVFILCGCVAAIINAGLIIPALATGPEGPTTFGGSAAGVASAGETHYEDKGVADAMVNRFVDSWNRADGAAYGENYWPEAELVDPSGVISNGRAEIVQEHVQLWAGIFKGSHITGRVRRIQMLGSNFMMVDFDVQVSGLRRLPPGSPPNAKVLKNHLKHILEKRNGVWKVLSAQNTFIAAHKL